MACKELLFLPVLWHNIKVRELESFNISGEIMRRKQWVALLASAMLCVTSAVSPAGGFVSYAAQEENGSTGTSAEEIKTEDASGGISTEEKKTENASGGASSAEVSASASSGSTEKAGGGASAGGSEKQADAGASSGVLAGEDKPADKNEGAADGESAGTGESAEMGEEADDTDTDEKPVKPVKIDDVVISGDDISLADSDTLFQQYAERQFGISSGKSGVRRAPRRSRLSGQNLAVYNALKTEIEKIANGTRTDTAISIPLTEILGEGEEISVNTSDQGKIDCLAFAENVNIEDTDFTQITKALLSDQ